MALSVIAVSISVSPLRMEDEPTDMFITSAPSRLPASSNEDCVRVEASKNRLICVRPRSVRLLLLDLAVELDEFLGQVEETDDLVARKSFDPQQVALAEDERRLLAQCSLKRDL